MKKKILAMILAAGLSLSFVSCTSSDKGNDKTTAKEGIEQGSSKKLSKKELDEKYERVKVKLSELFVLNGFSENESDIRMRWELYTDDKNPFGYTITLQNYSKDGRIHMMITSDIRTEDFDESTFDLDLDNSLINKAYNIFREEEGFKYGEHGVKLQEKMMENSKTEEETAEYEDIFKDGDYTHNISVLRGKKNSVFSISIILGDK